MERRSRFPDQERYDTTQPKSAPQKVTPQVIQRNARTRLRRQHHQQNANGAAPHMQLDTGYVLQKLEKTTGAKKAHTAKRKHQVIPPPSCGVLFSARTTPQPSQNLAEALGTLVEP